jgi:ATP-binding cassette subfamily F protein 3
MRVELAKLLLQKPDLLLLDEPTNHLDIEAIIWLEDFLSSYEGAIILVSHDRAFLDRVTNRTIEIVNGGIEDYPCSYSKYTILREERREHLANQKKNQDRQIKHTEDLIEKFRYKANKAKFAQSLIKQLERTERVEVPDEDTSSIHFHFPDAPRSGLVVFEGKNIVKNYGSKHVLSEVSFKIERGERVAFVGRNGEGKTTMAKILVGEESSEGDSNIGHNVNIGFYAQHQADRLAGNKTVFETIDAIAPHEMSTRVRGLLGAFLFSGDDIYKKVSVLSGGEKSRLALAKLLLEPYNLLVLDEPTNHLDMRSKDILKEALLDYNGTLLIVSHDRDFLDGLVNKIFYFRNRHIKEYLGGVYDFLKSQQSANFRELELKKENQIKNAGPVASNFERSKQHQKERNKLERQLQTTEKKITELEQLVAHIELKLSRPQELSASESSKIFSQYEDCKNELAKEMEQWTKWSEQLQQLTAV